MDDLPQRFVIRERSHRIHNPFTSEKLAILGRALYLSPGASVLDLACGSGEMLCTWARDHRLTGLSNRRQLGRLRIRRRWLLRQDGTVSERPIRLFGDPVLRTPCDAVDKFDGALISLVADLDETVSLPGRAGLAANQIGVSLRVFAYNVDGQTGHLVNPVIEAIEGEQDDDEGCLSIPGLWYPLLRAQYARARGVDRLGQPAVIEGEGLLARCIQHETDHLNGRLFVDRLSGSVRKQAMRDLRERYIS